MRPIPTLHKLDEARTKKGPHGGGNQYDELTTEREFKNLAKQAPQAKDEPAKADEPTIDPGEGAKGGKKAEAGKVKGFKAVGGDLKQKDKPGKVTKNETLDSALDGVLAETHMGTKVAFKAPEVLGAFGAPKDDDLDRMEQEVNGDLCPDCPETPEEAPASIPGAGTDAGDPRAALRARLAALGHFDTWLASQN